MDFDDAYANAAYIPGAAAYPEPVSYTHLTLPTSVTV